MPPPPPPSDPPPLLIHPWGRHSTRTKATPSTTNRSRVAKHSGEGSRAFDWGGGGVIRAPTPQGSPAAPADRTQRPDTTCEGKPG